jgi:hypothetical protein
MTDSATPDSRRQTPRAPQTDRRRQAWRAFRHAYPTFLKVAAFLFLVLVAVDIWLFRQRSMYQQEIDRLRSGMTESEREKSDLIVQSEQDKVRMALELARRQARWDPQLHLSVAVDSGRMYLERNGALLRDMRVTIAPDEMPVAIADTGKKQTAAAPLPDMRPRGERAIQEITTGATPAIILIGGTRIYGSDDTTAVVPGTVILPNVTAGMLVYFY